MSNQKRKHAGSDSDPYSSSPPSVEGNSVWPARWKEMENKMEEQGMEMKKVKNRVEEQENEIKELKYRVEEQDKEVRKLKKVIEELKSSKPTTSNNNWSSSGNPSVQEENTTKLKLYFKMNVAEPVYTSNNLVGDGGEGIQIRLIDAKTNKTITTGIESSVMVRFVVLNGSFNREGRENWSPEEFYSRIVKGREHKALLTGDLEVALKQGVGFIQNLTFMDNSQGGKFRIGVHVASDNCEGTRILEAFTEPFTVLHYRGKLNQKHYPPKSSDDVWRLEGIGKGGPFHNRLKEEGIYNVEQFLQAHSKNPEKLKSILGRMSEANWNSLIRHAQTCPTNGKWHNSSDAEADRPVKLPHQNREEVKEYEGEIPLQVAMAVPPGDHSRILVGPSFSQNHPTQISLQDHPESSAVRSQGFSIQPNAMTNSGVAAEHASTSQQAVQAVKTSMDPQLARISSPLYCLCFSDPCDCFNTNEVYPDMKWDP